MTSESSTASPGDTPASAADRAEVAIIGAGPAGLAAAAEFHGTSLYLS